MEMKPVLDNVLIKVDVVEVKSPGGLFLFSGELVVKNSGVVVAVGDSEVIRVKPGDHVLFEKGMGRRFDIPEKQVIEGVGFTRQVPHILIAYYDIEAVILGE
jgi:co-chaperonin GroES (HSP10)